ncbi:tetratricopeptide repeat protein [Hymenobacter properus]|uniref:Tetratricopeptide repeat protein n=1 Tax=Hymenobacter properus TaxID=2791026 RepID=A0A931BIC5_9BACT|nr:tetratricopeptide repeat protein [Hymenobacter properus]MBF9141892.1 tetratricopeptide repeat protein [Hymenobacter properus]MBR7720700.1 tetratricopeptide repeat protein [Microvirga sp. SRT04]
MDLVKLTFSAALVCAAPAVAWAQADQATAFASSYAAEAKADYADAIAPIKAIYTGTYEQNLRLGWLYFLAKNYTASAAHYQKAVEQRPYAVEPKFGLVKPLNALGQVEKMLNLYQDILKIDAQNTQANYWAGVIYLNRKSYAQAARYFERVVNLYPFDYDSTISLAWAYLNLGKKAEARALYTKALLIRPGDAAATAGLKRL